MIVLARKRQLVLVAALVTLALRALTPDGYMPATQGSGLLFELCPSGMPVVIMRTLAGDEHHHHHSDHGDESGSVSSAEQCPIGHLLTSAVAVDTGATSDSAPGVVQFDDALVIVAYRASLAVYHSRAPPA